MRRNAIKRPVRYLANRAAMVAEQDGYRAAARNVLRDVTTEVRKLPRVARHRASARNVTPAKHPTGYSDEILAAVSSLPVEVKPYQLDVEKFRAHVTSVDYPRAYAAGSLEDGGNRENKLLEYFVSLEILDVQPGDTIIDVASEYSIFPVVARRAFGATVFRQDLIYPAGIHRDRIGGNAASMDVGDRFADALVLHNSFEHFEGSADTDFIAESWRILKPGGSVVIVPLFVSDRYTIISDPFTDRSGVTWDTGADVIELPGWHNRFGRFYSPSALEQRVLSPATQVGYRPEILHFVNVKEAHPLATMHFSLVLRKPSAERDV